MNGQLSSPVSCSHNFGVWTLGVHHVEHVRGASDSTLSGQDPSIVRGDVVCKTGSIALSGSNALASDIAGTEGCLQTIAESRANSYALSSVNFWKGIAHCRKTYDVVGFSRGSSDNEVVCPASSVRQEVICSAASNSGPDDRRGSSGSHGSECSKDEGVLHDEG